MNSTELRHQCISSTLLGTIAGVLFCSLSMQTALAAPAKPVKIQQIEMVQQLPPAKTVALEALIQRFNAENADINIRLTSQSWNEKTPPHLLILNSSDEATFLSGKPRFKPLYEVMKTAGIPLQTLKPPSFMTQTPVNSKGQLLALPVGLSTPVLFINKDALRHAGLNPDTTRVDTWKALQNVLGRLAETGHTCPYAVAEPARVMIENLSAWHNEPITAVRGKNVTYSFNSMFQIKHIAMMASWKRADYLHVFNSPQEAEDRFSQGECAILAASSANWSDFRHQNKGALDIGIHNLPYYEDFVSSPQNTLADGPSMWITAGKSPAEYKAIARFVSYWLQPDNQVSWPRESGYLPLNRAGLLAASESSVLHDAFDGVRIALAQLTYRPVTPRSVAPSVAGSGREYMRQVLDEELMAVWDDRKPAKEALDTAVIRVAKKR